MGRKIKAAPEISVLIEVDEKNNEVILWQFIENTEHVLESASENFGSKMEKLGECECEDGALFHIMQAEIFILHQGCRCLSLSQSIALLAKTLKRNNAQIKELSQSALGESSTVTGSQTAVIPLTMDNMFKKINLLKAHPFFLRERVKGVLQDVCTDLDPSALRHAVTALQNIRKQDVLSPVNSLGKQECAASQTFCLNFIHLVGCDLVGASGGRLGKCCHHITWDQLVSLPNGTHVFTSKQTNDSRLEQVTASSDDTAAPCRDCCDVPQHKSHATSQNKKSADMHGQSAPHHKKMSVLETIEEEKEVEEDIVLNGSADTSELSLAVSEPQLQVGEDVDGDSYTTHPHNMCEQQRRTHGSFPSDLQLECHVEDLESASETSRLLERIAHYQMEYDELCEFTRNEKKIYEEFFSIQLSEANSKIQDLADENEHLKAELKASKDECAALLSALHLLEQSKPCHGNSNKSEPPGMNTTLLRRQLSESEMRRNDCEMRLELVERKFRSRTGELTQYLEDAWNELASFEQLNEREVYNGPANDVTKCAEPKEDGLPTEVTELEKEITTLKAALNKKTCEFHKLKKHLCHESKLMANIPDFEKQICTLKQENLKLSENLSGKIAELKATHATVSLLRDEIRLMENENVTFSKTLESSSKEVQSLKSRILNLEQEIDMLCSKGVTLSRSLEEKCEEIGKLTSENSKLKKENSELNDEIVKNNLDCTHKDVTELLLNNSRLKEEMCSVKNNSLILPNTLEPNIHGIKQLSKNSTQWDEVCSLKSGDAKIAELYVKESENSKLRDEISSFNYEVRSSECTEENIAAIQTAVNKNVTLKSVGEKIGKEMVMKVKRHNSEKFLLKDVSRLSNELKERVVEVNEPRSKLEEEKIQAEHLKTEALVHQVDNVKLSKMLNQKTQDACFRVADTQSVLQFGLNNISITENASFLKAVSQKHEELYVRTLKAETPSPNRTWTCENPRLRQSECTNQMMKVNLQEWKLNCLRKKVTWQKKILNKIQKSELQLKTNVEQYKRQEEILQCLKQDNALQQHRILLLELQAKHVDFVHKTRTNCLQSLVASLRNENLMLHSHLYHVQRQMADQWKVTKKCGNSKHKDIGIQSSFSSSDSVSDFGHIARSDCDVLQVCGLSNVHMETHNSKNQNLFSPYRSKHHLGETSMSHDISNVHMQDKRVRKAQKQNKFYSLNLVEKNIPMDSAETSPCKYVWDQHTGQKCYTDEGAEGWARLGREFDLQLDIGAYS